MMLFLIKLLPSSVIKKLRYMRELRDKLRGKVYPLLRADSLFPYYLKYSNARNGESSCLVALSGASKEVLWGEAFREYFKSGSKVVDVVWADTPIPGNFGDWLSPYILHKKFGLRVRYVNLNSPFKRKSICAVGSIISSVNNNSYVVGTGVGSEKDVVNIGAKFISVRGPYTDRRIQELGGEKVNRYGDLGFLLSRIYQPKKINKKDEVLVVRHINHAEYELPKRAGFREVSIKAAHPSSVESFIDEVCSSRLVLTSAMHCFITCISYSIPVILFDIFENESKIPGDGIKYRDSLAGVSLPEIMPERINSVEEIYDLPNRVQPYSERLSEDVIQDIEKCLEDVINEYV